MKTAGVKFTDGTTQTTPPDNGNIYYTTVGF